DHRAPQPEHGDPVRRDAGRPSRHRADRARLVDGHLAGRPCGAARPGLSDAPVGPPDRQLDGGSRAMNPTIEKFGYPATLIAEFDHWLVLLRPTQPTLGALVLAAKSDATAFGDLPAAAHAELKRAAAAIESALGAAVGYDRINYLMLMMVDPHVHFH